MPGNRDRIYKSLMLGGAWRRPVEGQLIVLSTERFRKYRMALRRQIVAKLCR